MYDGCSLFFRVDASSLALETMGRRLEMNPVSRRVDVWGGGVTAIRTGLKMI